MNNLNINLLKKLIDDVELKEYKGFDPYDIKGSKFYSKNFYSNSILPKIKRKTLDILEIFFPYFLRKYFKIEKKENAKAMGLFLLTYINLYRIDKEKKYLDKIENITKWLIKNSNKEYKGLSWGYPFDWNSIIFIEKHTPSSIASVTIGEAFIEIYKTTENKKYLEYVEKISEFMIEELNIFFKNENEICFSYTPIDNFQVHNINLLDAAFLIEAGDLLNRSDLIEYGKKATNFSISEQNKDGSIFYWSKEQNKNSPNHLDLYHSGFEIRALYRISKVLKKEKYTRAFIKYKDFFLKNYFEQKDIKITPNSVYPIDIHGCAEAINCISSIDEKKEYRNYADKALSFTMNNMYYKNNFIYKIIKVKGIKKKIKISYIRWGDAWMLKALSEYIFRYGKEQK